MASMVVLFRVKTSHHLLQLFRRMPDMLVCC